MIGSTQVMGILNVTPDSFSDGGRYTNEAAIKGQVRQLINDGADIIDVGGESTRPFAEPVSTSEELQRVIPAIKLIRSLYDIPISIDTTKAEVAEAALQAGASMLNDISALEKDPHMVEVAARYTVPVVIMHMQGSPEDMQLNPAYDQVVEEINTYFSERLAFLEQAGIGRERIIIDPGIGFGKTLEHNLVILANIKAFKPHGCPVLIGHSRKSFFEHLLGIPL
ncbi:MAG: dihydropteroate synthase, partial [Deltaproteobacteria bacterium]